MQLATEKKDLISVHDFNVEEMMDLFLLARELKKEPQPSSLKQKILANCFFEPSTRTRLSFESAMLRLGGQVIGFSESASSSGEKGETVADAMRVISSYCDLICIRHPREGAARVAAETATVPVINAGDGANQHPTQTLLDLYTIHECQERLDELNIALVGDLKFGRTVHSLALALTPFKPRFYFVSPSALEMPRSICDTLREKGVKFSFHPELEEILPKLDILYMTRIQKERISGPYRTVPSPMILKPELLEHAKANLKILHPLPRCEELPIEIDSTPFAHYFQQAENGLYIRQAILQTLIGGQS